MKPQDTSECQFSSHELLSLCLQLNARLDVLWHRVLYTHAAIVGVMVFFASSSDPFFLQRYLVFGFYTVNAVITVVAFLEVYSGLVATIADLKDRADDGMNSHVQKWILSRNYRLHSFFRVAVMALVWVILGYLLIYPLYT